MTRVSLGTTGPRPATRARAAVGSPEVAAVLSRLAGSTLVVDLDLAVRRGDRATARLHARHGLREGRVVAVTAALTGEVEVARFDVAHWQHELARTLTVSLPDGGPPPSPALDLPWELLVTSGAALARHRPDLYDELVARAAGSVRAGTRPLDPVGTREELRRLHGSVVGRLRAVGTGVAPAARPRVGWVSWLLFADGWRALSPYAEGSSHGLPRLRVRLEPRRPADLAVDVATWAAAVAA